MKRLSMKDDTAIRKYQIKHWFHKHKSDIALAIATAAFAGTLGVAGKIAADIKVALEKRLVL